MIPSLLSGAPVEILPAGSVALYFPGGATEASMGVGDSILITGDYDQAEDPINYFEFIVTRALSGTAWYFEYVPDLAVASINQAYDSSKANWDGPGVYTFHAQVCRVSTGLFDVTSTNVLTLTVT